MQKLDKTIIDKIRLTIQHKRKQDMTMKQTDRQTDRQIDRQTDRQTDRQ